MYLKNERKPKMNDKSTLNLLAEVVSSMDVRNLPAEVTEKAKLMMIDALEGCVAGNEIREGAEPLRKAMRQDSSEQATLLGDGAAVNAEDAIFYNIVTGTFSARNDIHTGARVHPGCTLVPAILGEAEAHHISGKNAVEAMVAGTETMIRMGLALQKGRTYPVSGSIRASMLATPLGNAFAQAKLFGLGEEETANAAALALNRLCGVNQWRLEATGEDAHQNAWDARNAIDATRFGAAAAYRWADERAR